MGAGKVDLAWGGAGADIFFFGEQTSDGERGRTAIGDFEVGTDALDLGGAEVAHKVILGSLILTLDGDHDQIVVTGVSYYDDALFV